MKKTIRSDIERVRDFYKSGKTRSIDFRIAQLRSLYNTLDKYESEIYDALLKDLNKSPQESFITELAIVKSEIKYMISKTKKLTRPKRVLPSIGQLPGSLKIVKEPYGSVLIISTWNYPIQLALLPLVGAIAAGNTVVLKPSEYSPETASLLKVICDEAFDSGLVSVILGGRSENEELLASQFDYIFFTGSTNMGKVVMKAAAENLTPLTLELGGKSPCIVDKNVNIKETAKRILFGKLINAGQTCIAPDYVYVHYDIKQELISELLDGIKAAIPSEEYFEKSFGKIVNNKHFNRLVSLLKNQNSITALDQKLYDSDTQMMRPVIIDEPSLDSDVMMEEIFGPILPIITWSSEDELINVINNKPKPLSMYIFSNDNQFIDSIIQRVDSGGVCINDTLLHISSNRSPFGGTGPSGMGAYHGKWSIDTFSRERTVLRKSWHFDVPFRHHPYSEKAFDFLRRLLG